MKTIAVEVRDDHLELMAKAKPMAAVAELIWNALDAESMSVNVEFVENELGGLESLFIRDNGHGLAYDDALVVFRNLGGSWKHEGQRTASLKRTLHGKFGKGRFRAFALGNRVGWDTVYAAADGHKAYTITGDAANPGEFRVSDPVPAGDRPLGTTVAITQLSGGLGSLRGEKARNDVADLFAPYLCDYPDVRLAYDGVPIDPASVQDRSTHYDLGELVMENGERVRAAIRIVEWLTPGHRSLMLCDETGFPLHTVKPKLSFRGFSYTAYVLSAHVAALDKEGLLSLEGLAPDVDQILEVARTRLRQHFTLREAERAQDVLQQWKEAGLYPYPREAATREEATERRIFDIYATHLNQVTDFSSLSTRTKRLILRLVQELAHAEPMRIARILDELVTLPEEKEEEVLNLLEA